MEQLQAPLKNPDSSPIFNITENGFKELMKVGLTLDQLFYLETVKHQVDLRDIVSKDKLMTWKQSLVRKGFITEACAMTVDGNALLSAVGSGKPFTGSLEKRKEVTQEDFDAWWKTYPSHDIFEYKGRKFEGSRSFKVKKEECRMNFHKIVNEGEVTGKDIIRCLEYEILLKKEESFKIRENKMKYLPNSLSYLIKRQYEGFLEISKASSPADTQTFEDI